jgi:hypothetical protein
MENAMKQTRTEQFLERQREEIDRASVRRMMDDQDRELGRGRHRSGGGLGGGNLVDGLIIGAIIGLFWLLWQALKYSTLGLFYGGRWVFRKMRKDQVEPPSLPHDEFSEEHEA